MEGGVKDKLIIQYSQQGRYIKALENITDPTIFNKIKSKCYYPIHNPEEQIDNYIGYFKHAFLETQKIYSLHETWQATTEEAIDIFENIPRTNKLTKNDAYQILKTSLCDWVKLSNDTKIYVSLLLDKIHKSPELIHDILVTKYVCRHNIHYVKELFVVFMLSSEIENDIKEETAYKYLNNLEYSWDLDEKTDQIVANIFSTSTNTKFQKLKLKYVLDKVIEGKTLIEISDKDMIQILIDNDDMLIVQYALAKLSIKHQIDYYNIDQAAMIFKKMYDARNEKYEFKDRFCSSPSDALSQLAALRFFKKTDVVTDEEIYNYIKEKKQGSFLILLEAFYKQGRFPSYQKLTLANNTNTKMKYVVRLSHDKTEEFVLNPTDKKIYENLRDANITHIGLKIYSGERLFVKRAYVDINAYVSCYGSKRFKFAVYYEPDASLASITPTSAMINDVAKVLQKEYNNSKKNYPSLTYDSFVRTLSCDEIGVSHHYNSFVAELNSLMRPTQLKKAVDIILEG